MPVGIPLTDRGEMGGKTGTVDAVAKVGKGRHGRNVSMAGMKPHWDIFCRVIDNLGDVGVCWRLARQLVDEHAFRVRLWVDDLAKLKLFAPGLDCESLDQCVEGIEIRHWRDNCLIDAVGDVVIEAFACELPAAYLAAMAARKPCPHWINLEYLSAESWVEGCHGLASPHPRLPLQKHFFFPGFTPASGGLLREHGLLAERDTYLANLPHLDRLSISLFCYPSAPVLPFLELLTDHQEPVVCLVPPGPVLESIEARFGSIAHGQIGSLTIKALPFLSHREFDRLLWECDINFVRGEDSFVRAQWAGKPFVWQIYEQADGAHLTKLAAFLAHYSVGLSSNDRQVAETMFSAWNGIGDLRDAWPAFIAIRAQMGVRTRQWAENLASQRDLVSALVSFCRSTV